LDADKTSVRNDDRLLGAIVVTRLEKILSCIDVPTETGLEVGALMNPIVTRKMGKIRYIDHATTEELRSKYAHDPNVDIDKIVDVDYVWGKEGLPELVEKDAPFDYLVASHVIEHVPDFIGWLQEIHAVLKIGGILSLVIPDKRYCFDYRRSLTQTADVIEAFLSHSRKPTPRHVFDYISSVVAYNGRITWDSSTVIEERHLKPMHSKQDAWDLANRAMLEDQYVDAHCWVFMPHSFFELLKDLVRLDLFGFVVEKFYESEGCEFYVSLKAIELKKGIVDDRQKLQLASLPNIASSSSPSSTQAIRSEKEKQKEQINKLTLQLAATQQELDALQSSQSWKITAPLRWLRNQL
jgi:predicted SAM-dependent methyltransferase